MFIRGLIGLTLAVIATHYASKKALVYLQTHKQI